MGVGAQRYLCQSASFVEATRVQSPSEGDAEGLGAEDAQFGQGQQRRIDGEGQLHRQLRGHDGRDDQGAVQEDLVAAAVWVLQPFLEHVPGGNHSEAQQHTNKCEGLSAQRGGGRRCCACDGGKTFFSFWGYFLSQLRSRRRRKLSCASRRARALKNRFRPVGHPSAILTLFGCIPGNNKS